MRKIFDQTSVIGLLALSLSACQNNPNTTNSQVLPQPTGSAPMPSAQVGATASPLAVPSSALILRLEADAGLQKFMTQQNSSFSLCLSEIQKTRLELRVTGSLTPSSAAALTAAGARISQSPDGLNLIVLEQNLDFRQLLNGLEFSLPTLSDQAIEGRNEFLDSQGKRLGFVSWRLMPSGQDRVLVKLKAAATPSESQACPLLEAQVDGAENITTAEPSPLVSPLPSPTASPPSPQPSASSTPASPELQRPMAPVDVRLVEQTTDSLTLQWNFGEGPMSHKLFLNGQLVASNHTTPNYYRFNQLKADTKYTLGVSAVNAAGESEVSSLTATTTLNGRTGTGNFSGGGGGGGIVEPPPIPVVIATPAPTPTPAPPNLFEAERLVNSYTSGGQESPSIAMNASGNFVVVWESGPEFVITTQGPATNTQDGSGTGIYAQRYNAAGEAQGAEIRINDYTDDDQSHPRVAIDTNGNFVVAWQSKGQNGNPGQNNVYARRFDAQGLAQGPEFRVDTGSQTHDRQNPVIAMLGSGEFIIAWEDLATANINLLAQLYEADGTPRDVNFSVGSTNRANIHPQMIVNTTGKVFITWNQKVIANNTHRINTRSFDFSNPSGSTSASIASTNEVHPVVAEVDNGGFALFYESGIPGNQKVVARMFSSGGGISSAFDVLPFQNLANFSASGSANGQVLLTWQQDQNTQSNIFGRRFARMNNVDHFSDVFPVNAYLNNQQQRPAVALAADGKFVVIWDGEGAAESAGVYGKGSAATVGPLLAPG